MDRYEACRKCEKRCCLNCTNFENALEFLPGQLVNITCSAQPEEKHTSTMGETGCKFHTMDKDFNVITKAIDGPV